MEEMLRDAFNWCCNHPVLAAVIGMVACVPETLFGIAMRGGF